MPSFPSHDPEVTKIIKDGRNYVLIEDDGIEEMFTTLKEAKAFVKEAWN